MSVSSPRVIIIRYFRQIATYLKVPNNDKENEKLVELARQLKIHTKKSVAAKQLLSLVMDHIEDYEKNHYPVESAKPSEMLAFLMEQHQLKQSDLPEIGSQSHVSKLLHGKRQLTSQQISLLSKRFNVSPSVWYAC